QVYDVRGHRAASVRAEAGRSWKREGNGMQRSAYASRDARELEILAVIAEALNRSPDAPSALERTLRLAAELLQCESGWIWLRDQRTQKFYLAAAYDLPPY